MDAMLNALLQGLMGSIELKGIKMKTKSITFENSTSTIFNLGGKKELQTNIELNICFYFVVVVVGVW